MPGMILVRSRSGQQFIRRLGKAKPSVPPSLAPGRGFPDNSDGPAGCREEALSTNPIVRCGWAGSDPLYVAYHDHEWGVPLHDERALSRC